MRIGISAPFNPSCIKEYLPQVEVPSINNAATSVNTLVLSLLQDGHYVKVFTINNNIIEPECIKGNNVEVYMVPTIISSKIGWFKHRFLLDTIYVYKRLTKVISSSIADLDVLHAHWTYDFALACMPFVNSLPVLVSVRDWAPKQCMLQTKLSDKVVWKTKLKKFKKVMGNDNVCYIANSEYTLNMILSLYPASKTSVIPNPISESLVKPFDPHKKNENRFISIAQDLDDKGKNIDPLIRAFGEYRKVNKQAELHLVGSLNKQGKNYTRWLSENLLDGVIVHGVLPRTEIIGLMDKMSCLVHPSLIETFGNVLLEAMARGVVCIGGRESGAVPYVLGSGKCGVLCNVQDPHDIYEAMCSLNEGDNYTQLAASANEMLLKHYMSKVIASRHLDLYKERIGLLKE